jgi:hypothetical protein
LQPRPHSDHSPDLSPPAALPNSGRTSVQSSSSVAASDAQASNVELAVLSALKAYVEGASRNANHQFATLADRLDRIERTRAEPRGRGGRCSDRIEITGTVKPITFDARNLGASHIE